jgi:hypothetical protein
VLQAQRFVLNGIPPGNKDNGDVLRRGILAQVREYGVAIHEWHLHIHENQVGGRGGGDLQRARAGRGYQHVVVWAKDPAKHAKTRGIIIDDKDDWSGNAGGCQLTHARDTISKWSC